MVLTKIDVLDPAIGRSLERTFEVEKLQKLVQTVAEKTGISSIFPVKSYTVTDLDVDHRVHTFFHLILRLL